MLFDALVSRRDFVLVDMPEIMLRMKIGSLYSLDQLRDIFNDILNKCANAGPGLPDLPDIAAYFYYPEVFQKPKDEFVAAMLQEIARDT